MTNKDSQFVEFNQRSETVNKSPIEDSRSIIGEQVKNSKKKVPVPILLRWDCKKIALITHGNHTTRIMED